MKAEIIDILKRRQLRDIPPIMESEQTLSIEFFETPLLDKILLHIYASLDENNEEDKKDKETIYKYFDDQNYDGNYKFKSLLINYPIYINYEHIVDNDNGHHYDIGDNVHILNKYKSKLKDLKNKYEKENLSLEGTLEDKTKSLRNKGKRTRQLNVNKNKKCIVS